MNRLTVFSLVMALLLSLAACGNVEEEATTPQPELVWRWEGRSLALPESLDSVTTQCVAGERLYIAGGESLFSSDSSREFKQIPLPRDYEFIYAICAVDKNLGVLAGNAPEKVQGENGWPVTRATGLELLVLAPDGTELSSTVLPEDCPYYMQMFYSGGNYICLSTNAMTAYDSDGELLASLKAEQAEVFYSITPFEEGVALTSFDVNSGGSGLYAFSADLSERRFLMEFPAQTVTGLGTDAAGELMIYSKAEAGTLDLDTGSYSGAFTAGEAGLGEAEIMSIMPWNGDLLLFSREQESLHYATSVLGTANSEKIELLLVSESRPTKPWLDEQIATFNNEHKDYFITARYLGEDYTEDMLKMDIMSGRGPDIYRRAYEEFNGMTYNKFLDDLLPYIDGDPELSRDMFVQKVFEGAQTGGELKWMPQNFDLTTCVTRESFLNVQGISVSELREYQENDERFEYLFSQWLGKDGLRDYIAQYAMGQFIDYDNFTCSFDSEEFKSLLKMINETMPDEPVDMAFGMESTLVNTCMILGIGHVYSREYEDGDYCFIGFPTTSGNGTGYSIGSSFAIASDCEHKEAAWDFIKIGLRHDQQYEFSFSVIQEVLDEQISDMIGKSYDGEHREFTQEDADKLLELLDGMNSRYGGEVPILNIIRDESDYYFAGVHSLDETVELIQSRVSLYLGEQS